MGGAKSKESIDGGEAMKAGSTPEGKPLKPCCACPETRRARDECIVQNGEEACTELIQAHKECMKKMGFNL
ncbi:unnamed protein product [Darwinula stevensoni]|uniref:Cytochrome c oxidase copper chaperone n=1 Tax=Darwinula stevensoni TaxID=69355 RepID=A0A7R8X2C9_9CRUS|nr:unnamed protein product [Darwinula stevensoni]CAG0883807.1 unnamed protein product [Darwinula stevensoni]